MTMFNLICFALGLAVGSFMVSAVVMFLRPMPPTPEQRTLAKMREVGNPLGTSERDMGMPEPWEGYSALPIDVVRQRLRGLTLHQREVVRAYESANRGSRGILNVLTALDEERANGG